jgi:hyperosmotically inducible protein
MKRYRVGVFLLCLAAAGGCSKQQARSQNQERAANALQQGDQSKEPWLGADAKSQDAITQARLDEAKRLDAAEAEKMGLPEQLTTAGGATSPAAGQARSNGIDAAETEKMGSGLPAHREKRETASAVDTLDTGTGTSTARAPSFGNPPGAFTTPGTTKAVAPAQGALQNNANMKGTDARGGDNDRPAARQGDSDSDRLTTQRIRRAILDDDTLSYEAKNVRVATRKGNIVLSGLVRSDRERWEIERKARGYAGSGTVDNRLELKQAPAPASSPSN